jgi:LysR family transcriptional regulator for metE and metH
MLSYSPWAESTVCQRLLVPAGVTPAQLLQVRLTEAIVEMAKAGLGVGVLSKWAVAPHVAAGTLRALPLTRARFGRLWSAATLKRAAALPYVSDFIDCLVSTRPFEMEPVRTAGRPKRRASRRATRTAAGARRVA